MWILQTNTNRHLIVYDTRETLTHVKQQNEYVSAANAWIRHIVGILQHNRSDGVNEIY